MQPLCWTEAEDAVLRRQRAAGVTWDGIAARLGVSRNVVIARAARIAIPRQRIAIARPAAPVEEDPGRPPLPAGHPRSWGILTAGTQLEGTPYPLPVFS